MDYREILNQFFENYGSTITDVNTNKTIKGIIAPVKDLNLKYNDLSFSDLGFLPKSEWVLICELDEDIIKVNNCINIDNKIMKVINCDNYLLADKPFYKRAYLYQVKEL